MGHKISLFTNSVSKRSLLTSKGCMFEMHDHIVCRLNSLSLSKKKKPLINPERVHV